jgi:cellulose synthase/poly-beta-1,6-N-acetylglucosamine synthase-like glycosyltransferase
MIDLEIPLGKRKPLYRFFEMVPALLSYGSLVLLVLLSIWSPLFAAIYLLLVIVTLLIKAAGIAYHTISGRNRLERAQKVDWHDRLHDFEDPEMAHAKHVQGHSKAFAMPAHIDNLRLAVADPAAFPKPSSIYNAVIVAAYNESIDIIEPTIESLKNTTYDQDHLIVMFAYEQRGGAGIKQTAETLQKKYKQDFKEFRIVEHPADMPNEVVGKGGNITYAGHALQALLDEQGIAYKDVIVTTLDCDNHPHAAYFDYLTYEYIVREDRKHLSYQPISLFFKNIWDAPAAMRVIATGNSFWNIISSMRPHTLRNFASHSQPMEALVEMNFWSVRTIVEDGHQYWRSYFYFGGNYEVVPLFIPIYQDAVLAETYGKTLKAQFVQLRRWAYGASDVPYVATRIFTKNRNVPLLDSLGRFIRLIDGHLTLATVSIIVTVGGWLPLLINNQAYHDVVAHQLPDVISYIQRVALVGLFITVFLAFKLLPPRPERYKRHRTIFMLLQWILMPVTSIVYSAFSALYAQTRLLLGKYLDKFDVTAKVTHEAREAYRVNHLKEKKKRHLSHKKHA